MRKNTFFLFILFLFISSMTLACRNTNFDSSMDYSQFQLVYSYEVHPVGDKKYFKLIKHLGSQWKLSYKIYHYIYYYNGNYYIFHKRPLKNGEKPGKPIVISEEDADKIMAK